ncbi:glycosyltransferase family 4 protein [Lacticigenium naphthae]|uniref:glycosyltransferase family 4 protein n=1 Tax=Lacticigenium naphthae TaxID=515351 RepID=UPI0006877D71|nr:glycosyltransferase family 4 protein [Lacticigenium naphthae]
MNIGDYNKQIEVKGMKILHINSYYNGSKFYKNLYDQQKKMGLDISVFVPVSLKLRNVDSFGKYTTISVNHSKYDRLIFYLKHKKILNDVISKYEIKDYSVLHAHSLFSNGFIAMKLKEEYGIPYVVAVRNADVNVFFKKMIHLRKLGIKIFMNADRVIFLSESYRDSVINEYVPELDKENILNKSQVIPNGIEGFWLDNTGLPKKINNKCDIKLLQVGDINKNKNIIKTAKVTSLLNKKGFNVELNIVGKIKDQKIFNEIKGLDYINYLGYKSKEDLINIYRENDIFILPSIYETFGLVYAEAMSQGLPIIYSKGQGFDSQFADGEVGYSVDCYNEENIAEKVIRIVSNYEGFSNSCLVKVHEFNWKKIVDRYSNIYSDVLNEE